MKHNKYTRNKKRKRKSKYKKRKRKTIRKKRLKYKRITISPRNKLISKSLKKEYKKVIIAKTNQEVIDKSDWIFLAITPTVGNRIIKDLKFNSKQKRRKKWKEHLYQALRLPKMKQR